MTWDFPDYTACCPLCGGEHCAVRIGFYKRNQVVIGYEVYENVPIARWLCRRKGTRKPHHKTFSLLPYQLVPYHSHALAVIFDAVTFQYNNGTSFEQTKSFISGKGLHTDIALENNQIHDFLSLFSQALLKLNTIPELKQRLHQASYYDSSDPIGTMLKFINGYNSPVLTTQRLHASRVEKLSLDFCYYFQTGDYFDRHFLFGTASQKLAA